MKDIQVMVADESHVKYVDTILQTIADAAKVRGTGIAKRSPEYVATKMREAKAVIALEGERFAGFSYIETWGNKHYVTTSGLIVHPKVIERHVMEERQAYQEPHLHVSPRALAPRQDLLAHVGIGRDDDEHPAGLPSRDLQRPHRR